MNLKKIAKKWGAYALGIMAVTGGMIATNDVQISASEDYYMFVYETGKSYDDSTQTSSTLFGINETHKINCMDMLISGALEGYSDWNLYEYEYHLVNVDTIDFDNIDWEKDVISVPYWDGIFIGDGTDIGINYKFYSPSGNLESFISSGNFLENIMKLERVAFKNLFSNEGSGGDEPHHSEWLEEFETAEWSMNTWIRLDGFSNITLDSSNNVINNYVYDWEMMRVDPYSFHGSANYLFKEVSFNNLSSNASGGYSQEEYEAYGESQFEAGAESVDITTDNVEFAEQYIIDNNYHSDEEYLTYGEEMEFAGYQSGYADAEENIDITADNESAINQYITDNNMKTEAEYNAYGESQFEAGAESVDITADNESAINQYITDNNMKTEAEYNAYGESKFEAGADSVDITSNDKAVFDKGYAEGAESVDITTDNEEIYNTAYDEGYADNKFWKQVGRLFSNIGSLFVNAWTGVKGWFR